MVGQLHSLPHWIQALRQSRSPNDSQLLLCQICPIQAAKWFSEKHQRRMLGKKRWSTGQEKLRRAFGTIRIPLERMQDRKV